VQKRTAIRILNALLAQRRYDRQHGTSKRFLLARRTHARTEGQMEADYGI
jgi:hypothetical protein